MRKRLNESFELISTIEEQKTDKQKEQNHDGTKDSQVSNG